MNDLLRPDLLGTLVLLCVALAVTPALAAQVLTGRDRAGARHPMQPGGWRPEREAPPW